MCFAGFRLDNSYARDLEGLYQPWQASTFPGLRNVQLNKDLARQLGLDAAALEGPQGAATLTGGPLLGGAAPLAMAYAGHQFGGFSPSLGDGRAVLLGEHLAPDGTRWDIHLKGSGRTPYSRNGDGKAALGPMLREFLISEAMAALGVPTTRALAVVATGEEIQRTGPVQGAILVRVAASHLRVGTFQYFAARGEQDKLQRLADFTLARHFPDLVGQPGCYLSLLERVGDVQAHLIAHWMLVGFVHGVMNTDNVALSGETIDYGPCAFMDDYDPKTVFSSIDTQGRYAYANQPRIGQWNLARFAETLIERISPDDSDEGIRQATRVVNAFPAQYEKAWLAGMQRKLGWTTEQAQDLELANGLFAAMHGQQVDFTLFFRNLALAVAGDDSAVLALFNDTDGIVAWLELWRARCALEPISAPERMDAMNQINPVYIPRNHLVEEALVAATAGDPAPFEQLLKLLQHPFDAQPNTARYQRPEATTTLGYRTYCGT